MTSQCYRKSNGSFQATVSGGSQCEFLCEHCCVQSYSKIEPEPALLSKMIWQCPNGTFNEYKPQSWKKKNTTIISVLLVFQLHVIIHLSAGTFAVDHLHTSVKPNTFNTVCTVYNWCSKKKPEQGCVCFC